MYGEDMQTVIQDLLLSLAQSLLNAEFGARGRLDVGQDYDGSSHDQ